MIIQRRILKELSINLLFSVSSISILLFMERFVRLTSIIMWKGTDIKDVFKVFIYLQPSILILSFPMALLISIFLTYGRMLADNEIVILKNSGMNFLAISKMPILLSLFILLIMLFLSLYLTPKGMQSFKKTLYETIARKALMVIEKESFSRVFKDTVLYINEIPSKGVFRGVFVYKEGSEEREWARHVVITARDGKIISNPEEGLIKLILHDGVIHTVSRGGVSKVSFSEYDFVLSTVIDHKKRIKPSEIETTRLWQGRREDAEWDIEFNRRLAIPFACLIFGIIGPAASMKMGGVGRLGGLSISLLILLLYYVVLIATEGLAKAGKIPVFMGEWIPNIAFLIIAIVLFLNSYGDKPVKRL